MLARFSGNQGTLLGSGLTLLDRPLGFCCGFAAGPSLASPFIPAPLFGVPVVCARAAGPPMTRPLASLSFQTGGAICNNARHRQLLRVRHTLCTTKMQSGYPEAVAPLNSAHYDLCRALRTKYEANCRPGERRLCCFMSAFRSFPMRPSKQPTPKQD